MITPYLPHTPSPSTPPRNLITLPLPPPPSFRPSSLTRCLPYTPEDGGDSHRQAHRSEVTEDHEGHEDEELAGNSLEADQEVDGDREQNLWGGGGENEGTNEDAGRCFSGTACKRTMRKTVAVRRI